MGGLYPPPYIGGYSLIWGRVASQGMFFGIFVFRVTNLSLFILIRVSLQCRSKGNISGGARERWRREPLGGCGGMLPQKILKSKGLEMQFQRSPRAICDLRTSRIIYFVHCLSKPMHIESIERFSSDGRKTKTKAITPTKHNTNKQRREPITVHSNYL